LASWVALRCFSSAAFALGVQCFCWASSTIWPEWAVAFLVQVWQIGSIIQDISTRKSRTWRMEIWVGWEQGFLNGLRWICMSPSNMTNKHYIEFRLVHLLVAFTMQRALLWSLAFLLAFIILSMPEIVPCTQVAQWDFSTFQVPCSNVSCKCFFLQDYCWSHQAYSFCPPYCISSSLFRTTHKPPQQHHQQSLSGQWASRSTEW
jgi:hypothetical protein